MEVEANICYLSLGSNIGNRVEYLQGAIDQLAQIVKIGALSKIYETEAWGYDSENSYLNCCIEIFTSLTPFELLKYTQAIEIELGRTAKGDYQDRTIDIDILTFGDQQIQTPDLTIPHPLMQQRAFVILPLLDIASEFIKCKHFLTNDAQLLQAHKSSGIKEFNHTLRA